MRNWRLALKVARGQDPYLNLIDQPLEDMSESQAHLFNWARGHTGPIAQAGMWINDAISFEHIAGGVRIRHVNERIVEIPFCLSRAGNLPIGSHILDLGASESLLSLHLATLGYKVTAVDFRPYPFQHPNLVVISKPIEEWEGPSQSLDMVISLSTLEHVGARAYGGRVDEEADGRVLSRLERWLKPGGKLLLTVPFGEWRFDSLQRTYDRTHLEALLAKWRIKEWRVFQQVSKSQWVEVAEEPTTGSVALITAVRD